MQVLSAPDWGVPDTRSPQDADVDAARVKALLGAPQCSSTIATSAAAADVAVLDVCDDGPTTLPSSSAVASGAAAVDLVSAACSGCLLILSLAMRCCAMLLDMLRK